MHLAEKSHLRLRRGPINLPLAFPNLQSMPSRRLSNLTLQLCQTVSLERLLQVMPELRRHLKNPRTWQIALAGYWLALFVAPMCRATCRCCRATTPTNSPTSPRSHVLAALLATTWQLAAGHLTARHLVVAVDRDRTLCGSRTNGRKFQSAATATSGTGPADAADAAWRLRCSRGLQRLSGSLAHGFAISSTAQSRGIDTGPTSLNNSASAAR